MNTQQRDTCEQGEGFCIHKAKPQTPERNAAGIAYPSIQTQEKYWEQRDIGGNTTLDRTEATADYYDHDRLP